MGYEPTILRQIRAGPATTNIVQWHFTDSVEISTTKSSHMLEMLLPPRACEASGYFADLGQARYKAFGSIFFRPAGLELKAKIFCGTAKFVSCVIEPDYFDRLLDIPLLWTEPRLERCMNLKEGRLASLFNQLQLELENPGLASSALIEAYYIALLVEAARFITGDDMLAQENCGRMAPWQVRRLNERLAQDGPPPSVSELASLCGISPRHLLRRYRELQGETLVTRIERHQMAQAKRLLRETDMPLKRIAQTIGFAHAANFSAAFRRVTGFTPRTFRQFGTES